MTSQPREPRDLGIDLLWEIPLALLSWAFFHLNKALIGLIYQVYLDRQAQRSRCWTLFSGATLEIPVSLPVLLTKGPRWNTHAAIGTLGPLPVRTSLAVATDQADRSASAWSVVVYRYPGFQTVREIGSLDEREASPWSQLRLPQGRYCLGVRYYGLQPGALLPAVRTDWAAPDTVAPDTFAPDTFAPDTFAPDKVLTDTVAPDTVAAQPVPPGINAVYDTLAQRTSPYHHALHHYVHTILRLRRWLPASFVRREFLPVGDPCTEFRFDWFPAGCALQLLPAERLRRDYRLYLSVYNRASLPIHSCELVDPIGTTPSFSQAGFYLLRLRPRRRGVPPSTEAELIVRRLCG